MELDLKRDKDTEQAMEISALKERDWEECCEEVKAALRAELKTFKEAYDALQDENKALQERLANLNLVEFESGDKQYEVPKAAVDNWETMAKDYAFLYKKFKVLRISRDALLEASHKIKHWHDWGKENEGMVVSSESVRELWKTKNKAEALKEKETE